MEERDLTFDHIGTCTGVSAQAAHKWTTGGDIQYKNLRRLADCLEVNWLWLRYGPEALKDIEERGDTLSEEAKGVGKAWQGLPPTERVAMKTAIYALEKSQKPDAVD